MINLIKSSFYNEVETKKSLADFVLNTNIFSMNQQCKTFENSFATKQGREFAVFVNNGSVANFLLIQALLNQGALKKGDKVGFSALTWPTNVMPLLQLGLEPIAIDCELDTLNISPNKLIEHTDKLAALFITNVLGFCDDLPKIKQICSDNDILLLEDNCESLGSKCDDILLGNYGLASTFSFFVGHHMSTIEGGMICTDDPELHNQLVIARAHGWDRNLSPNTQNTMRKKSGVNDFYAKYTFYDLASNFRPTEINGFIGNKQLVYWDEIVNKRVSNYHRFADAMNSNEDFYKLDLTHMNLISNFSMPIICKTPELAVKYKALFTNADVEIRPIIAGDITKQPFYKKYVKNIQPCPNSDLIHSNGFYFGNNPDMTEEEIDYLCKLLTAK